MAENREYFTHQAETGGIHIADDVLLSIAASAIGEIDGIVTTKSANVTEQLTDQLMGKKQRGIRVTESDGALVVDINLMMRYGFSIPDVASRVQDAVGSAMAAMTGFAVRAVNVNVCGIYFE